MSVATEKATFGAGCFWGVEAAFRQVHGVTATAVGYMGGDFKNPTYRDVCTDQTGHAEVVEVTFDPSQVSYAGLAEGLLGKSRPHAIQPSGARLRQAVSHCDILPLARAGSRRPRVEGSAG